MSGRAYNLKAEILTVDAEKIKVALTDFLGAKAIIETAWGFVVRATLEGENAADLNSRFLSALRRISKVTSLRSEWSNNGVTESFFDYVPRGKRP